MAAARAHGKAPGVHVETRGQLPFSRAALQRALAARLAPSEGLRVEVVGSAVTTDGARLQITVQRLALGLRRRGELSLSGAETDAEEAARAVALFVAELARPAIALSLPGDDAAPAPAVVHRAPAAMSLAPARLRLGLAASVGSGLGGGRLRAGAQLEATLRLRGPLRLLAGGGFDVLPSSQQQDIELRALAVAARLGAALDLLGERLSLRLWALVQPFFARGRVGALDVGHTEVLGGVGVGALYAFAISRRVQLTAALTAELLANRVELLVRGTPTMASDRLTLLASVGLRWSAL